MLTSKTSTARNYPDPSNLPTISSQASPQPFNPTANTFQRQSLKPVHPPPNSGASAPRTPPAAVKQRFPVVKPDPADRSQSVQTGPNNETPLTTEELDEQNQKSFQLQTLLGDASPQLLETSVEEGVKILDRIKAPLEVVADSADAQQWIQQIGMLNHVESVFSPH